MNAIVNCPICRNANGGKCQRLPSTGDYVDFDCDICGFFRISGTLSALDFASGRDSLSSVQRAALSHALRQHGSKRPHLTSDWLKRFLSDARLPTPARQATNAIRFIGDHVSGTGEKLRSLPIELYAIIGAPSPELASELVIELKRRGWLDGEVARTMGLPPDVLEVNLTLAGWEHYEAERTGQTSTRIGFLALKFGMSALDALVRDVIKPSIKEELGFDVFDMRDVPRAGIIDNLMRQQIRDSAFVLVDLTHDNAGAYWEAGYAEGLGKPVIYMCEQTKFQEAQTHFDTNHCTTVVWLEGNADEFRVQLVATLRRSLNLFASR